MDRCTLAPRITSSPFLFGPDVSVKIRYCHPCARGGPASQRGLMDRATAFYSCDDHLDLRAVPPDVWESRLTSDLRERGPRVVERDGQKVWVCEDRVLGQSGRPQNSAL